MRSLIQWRDARPTTAINSLALLLLLVIGAIDYVTPPEITTSVDLVRAADRLMYQVKTAGKDAFLHRVWPAAA